MKSYALCVLIALIYMVQPGNVIQADDDVIKSVKNNNADNSDKLIVSNLSLFVSSSRKTATGSHTTSVNSRALFSSTLPGSSILSRRLNANSKEMNSPMPLGLITFKGTPVDDVDVVLEFKGRNLAHWVPARKLSGRVYWRSLNLTTQNKLTLNLKKENWLTKLRQSDSLTIEFGDKAEKFLLYDFELKYQGGLNLLKTKKGYQLQNDSPYPIHDVIIFEPEEGVSGWKIAYRETLPAGRKKKTSKEDDSKSKKEDPDSIFEKAAEVKEKVEEKNVEVADEKPTKTKKETKDTPAKTKTEPKKKPKPLKKHDAPYLSGKREPLQNALAVWGKQNSKLKLSPTEMRYISDVLKKHALQKDQATVIYRLDDDYLEKMLPLEITPAPDILNRVAIVILLDADPRQRIGIGNLISQLGDNNWKKRTEAYQKLKKTGLVAQQQLQEATKHKDVEIASSAERLLDEIELSKKR